MVAKGVLLPKITVEGMPGFLLWARQAQPELFNAIARQFPVVATFAEQVGQDDRPGDLRGFTDILSSIGGGIASAASSIGSFVANNAGSIFSAAGGYLIANQQAKVAQAQLALAQANRPPLQTAMVTLANGQTVPVPVQATGTAQANGAPIYSSYLPATAQQQPGIMASLSRVPMTTWLIGAGALATVLLLVKRR